MKPDLPPRAKSAAPQPPRASDDLSAPFLDSLHANGRLRVWSIVMTIFGDMVHPRSSPQQPARLALSDLSRLTEGLGIAAGALRTAMSRLTKEGWLERHKEGRSAWYQLSFSGAANAEAASRRIYAPCIRPAVEVWRLEMSKPHTGPEPGFAPPHDVARYGLSDTLFLTPLPATSDALTDRARPHSGSPEADSLIIEGRLNSIPAWLLDSLIPISVTQDYAELAGLLQALSSKLDQLRALSPQDAIVLRCLLLHFWRRLILKHRPLPLNLLPQDWPGLDCSRLLPPLYDALWPASEAWLHDAGLPSRRDGAPLWGAPV